jgi:hypothetical protein
MSVVLTPASTAARPTQEAIDLADTCLDDTGAPHLSADPTTVLPFGFGSSIEWAVAIPERCHQVRVYLTDGEAEWRGNSTGSLRISQRRVRTVYSLLVKAFGGAYGLRRNLRSVAVVVDTSQCDHQSVDEEEIESQIGGALGQLEGVSDLTHDVTIAQDGVRFTVQFLVPWHIGRVRIGRRVRVTIDGLLVLQASGRTVDVRVGDYTAESRLLGLRTPMIEPDEASVALVLDLIKSHLAALLQERVDRSPPNFVIFSIEPGADRVDLFVCGKGP